MNLLVKTCSYNSMNIQRVIARGVVLLGVLVCGAAMFGAFAEMGYTARSPIAYASTAAIPLVIAIVVFVIGLYFELLAAAVLVVGAAAIAVWGFIGGWDANAWMAMVVVIIGPMILSGTLFLFAAQTQKVCELEESAAKA